MAQESDSRAPQLESEFYHDSEILKILHQVPSFPMTDEEIIEMQSESQSHSNSVSNTNTNPNSSHVVPNTHNTARGRPNTSSLTSSSQSASPSNLGTSNTQKAYFPSRTHPASNTTRSGIQKNVLPILPHSISPKVAGPDTPLSSSLSSDSLLFRTQPSSELENSLSDRQHEIVEQTPLKIVTLNLSGKTFTTTTKTLLKYQSSFFINLFDSDFHILKDSQGNVFIDRSPDYFALILHFLQTGNLLVHLPENLNMQQLKLEIEYFGLSHIFKPRTHVHIARPFSEGYYVFQFQVEKNEKVCNSASLEHFFAIAFFPSVQKTIIWDGTGYGKFPWFPPFAITEIHEFTRPPPYRTRPYSLTKSSNGTTLLLIGDSSGVPPTIMDSKTVFGKFVAEGDALIFHNNSCRFETTWGGKLPGCPFTMRFVPWK